MSEGAPGLAQPPVVCPHLSEGAPRLAQPEEHEVQELPEAEKYLVHIHPHIVVALKLNYLEREANKCGTMELLPVLGE